RDFNRKKERAGSLHPEDRVPPCSLKREADDESRSAVAGVHIDRAAVVIDHLPGDIETKTRAAFTFSGEKGFENMRYIGGRDSGTGIGNGDPHVGALDP